MKAVPWGQIHLQTEVWKLIYQLSFLNTRYEKTFLVGVNLTPFYIVGLVSFIFRSAIEMGQIVPKSIILSHLLITVNLLLN